MYLHPSRRSKAVCQCSFMGSQESSLSSARHGIGDVQIGGSLKWAGKAWDIQLIVNQWGPSCPGYWDKIGSFVRSDRTTRERETDSPCLSPSSSAPNVHVPTQGREAVTYRTEADYLNEDLDTTAIRPPVEPGSFIAFLSCSHALRLGSGGLTRDLQVSRVLHFGFWGNKAAI
ncbi:hypothetical protein B0H14DRAFT_3125528 [Mycena olivaceomarginata]|nr:hypothetical protein B0H14DRAFT_3125528 [Mycena olivaceomarginata]